MKLVRITTIFICLVSILNVANGQTKMYPQKIKVKENYTHPSTLFVFPKVLFGDYQRKSIYSFDNKNQNIGVTYEKNQNGEKTTFSLYLYPAGDAYEGRLREEYKKSLHDSFLAMKKEGLHAKQHAVQHKGEKYICNGLKAAFVDDNNAFSNLTVFESGTWFYKVRITSNKYEATSLTGLEKKILQLFDPTILTDLTLLNEKVDAHFAKTAFQDSILLGSAMGSAFRKIDWVMENVDEKERATGFPDLYIGLHVEGLKAFMEFQHRFDYEKSDFTKKYLKELQLISDAGFLTEFVLENYEMILIFPEEGIPNRYDDYLRWKSQNNITINLDEKFYILSFKANK